MTQPTEEVLRPCPHCGARSTYESDDGYRDWHVECYKCGCRTSLEDSKAEAIAAWNARPSPDEATVERGRLIWRLRYWKSDGHPHGPLHGEAAAEIDRLNALLEQREAQLEEARRLVANLRDALIGVGFTSTSKSIASILTKLGEGRS